MSVLLPEAAYLLGAIVLAVVEVVLIIRKIPFIQNILYALFVIYGIFVIRITIFPIYFDGSGYDQSYNFIPFYSMMGIFGSGLRSVIRNLVGNIVLFIPLGILTPIATRKRKFWEVLFIALLCSIGIELLQLCIGLLTGSRYRSVDVDDVILNMAGAAAGYGFYRLFPKGMVRLLQGKK